MHHMQCVSSKHSLMPQTFSPLLPLILPVRLISAKQPLMVKGLMLHSGHNGNARTKLWRVFKCNGTLQHPHDIIGVFLRSFLLMIIVKTFEVNVLSR